MMLVPALAPGAPVTPAATRYRAVSAALNNTCALREDGEIACWGGESWGLTNAPRGPFKDVTVANWGSCGLRPDGTPECWGTMAGGAGEAPRRMPSIEQMPSGPFSTLWLDKDGACGLRPDGALACWGDLARAPVAPLTSVSVGSGTACGLARDGTISCWGRNHHGEATPPPGRFTSVSVGGGFACAIRVDGTLACWGDPQGGQTTAPAGVYRAVAAGVFFACAIRSDGGLVCWGAGNEGQLKPPAGPFGALAVAQFHGCAIAEDGQVACWGHARRVRVPGMTVAAYARATPFDSERILRVAMTGNYWPLHAADRDFPIGLEAELARGLGADIGFRVQFLGKAELGSGALDGVAAGKADVAISAVTATAARRSRVDFTRPYLTLRYRLAAREEGGEPAGGGASGCRKVAAPEGPALATARELLPGAIAVRTASVAEALALVERARVDCALGEDVGMILAMRGKRVRLVGPPLGAAPIAMAVPKGEGAFFDEALGRLGPKLAELQKRYRPGEPLQDQVPERVFLRISDPYRVCSLRAEHEVGAAVDLGLRTSDLEIEGITWDSPLSSVVDQATWQWIDPTLPGTRPVEPWNDSNANVWRSHVQISVRAHNGPGTQDTGIRRSLPSRFADPARAVWARLDDGTIVYVEEWGKGRERTCDGGLHVAVVRGSTVRLVSMLRVPEEGD